MIEHLERGRRYGMRPHHPGSEESPEGCASPGMSGGGAVIGFTHGALIAEVERVRREARLWRILALSLAGGVVYTLFILLFADPL